MLDAEDAALRGDTADLIGQTGSETARPALEKLLTDPNPDVVEIAEEALDGLQDLEGSEECRFPNTQYRAKSSSNMRPTGRPSLRKVSTLTSATACTWMPATSWPKQLPPWMWTIGQSMGPYNSRRVLV